MNTVQIYTWNFIGTQKEPRLYKPDMSKWSPYELDVEAPEDYILPDGYDLATAESGEPIIIDSKGNGCELIHYQGKPAIVTNNGIIILKSAAAAALGRKGGSVKSEAKARAVRENGKKGGRPKMYKQAEMLKVVGVMTMEELDQIGHWNGEYYTVDGMTITPQYKQIGEDEFELTGYKIDK